MNRFAILMASAIFAVSAMTGARAASTFDFRTGSGNQFHENGSIFDGSFGEEMLAYGFHLFYNIVDGDLVAQEVKAVGMTQSDKGLGVRDPNVGNNEGRESNPYQVKQELLILQFATPDWRPVEFTTRAGRNDTAIVYAANAWEMGLPQDSDSFLDGIFSDMVALQGGAFTVDLDSLLPTGDFQFLGIASQFFNLDLNGDVIDDDGNKFSVQSVVGVVPVPASLPLVLTGLAGLGLLSRRGKKFRA